MSNFSNQSSYNIRTQIRNIINEKYKDGFPVVKELIQNANDAEASDLYFIMTDGFSECKHPLLKSKSLIVLNNGKFTNRDSINIKSIWSDDKSHENKIGKFGLGLKSIFHWCEAFFWYTNNVNIIIETSNSIQNYEFINPWELTDKDKANNVKEQYPEWSEFSGRADFQIIEEVLKSLINDYTDWFYVLIPLRDDRIKTDFCITPEKPGKEEDFIIKLFNNINQEEIVNVLTMMSSLQRIFFGNIKDLNKLKSIEKKKVCFPKTLDANNNEYSDLNKIIFNDEELDYSISYTLVNTNAGNEIKESDHWRGIEGRREKVYEEAAVSIVIFSPTQSKPSIKINYSSYLPLTEMSFLHENLSLSLGINFHGYFKVDSGRTKVEFFNENQDQTSNKNTVDHKWNSHIADKIMFPLLLPAIFSLYENKKLDVKQVSQLIKTLKNHFEKKEALLYFDPIKSVCRNGNIIIRNKAEELVVELLPTEKKIYIISGKIIDNIELFPSLKMLLNKKVFILDSSLKFSNRMNDKWTIEMLKELWKIDFNKLENIPELFGSLIDFTIDNIDNKNKEGEFDIFQILKKGIIESGLLSKENFISKIRNFTPLRILNCGFNDTKDLIQINRHFPEYLFVKKLSSQEHANNNLAPGIILEILAWLDANGVQGSTNFAMELLNLLSEEFKTERTESLKIIELTDSDSNTIFFNMREFNALKFVLRPTSENKLIKVIEACFQDVKLWKITVDSFQLLNSKVRILTCQKHASNDLIEIYGLIDNIMDDFNNRVELIKVLVGNLSYNNQTPKLIRKLFYGNREDNNKMIYLYQKEDSWYKLAKELNSQLDELLVVEVFAEITNSQLILINAKMMSEEIPESLLRKEIINIKIEIEEKHLDIIYRRIPEYRELAFLPIFRDIDNKLINIDLDSISNYFLIDIQHSIDLPNEPKYIMNNQRYSQALKEIGLKEFDQVTLIRILLTSYDPSEHFETIAKNYHNIKITDDYDKIKEMLIDKYWIKISDKLKVAPINVYDISSKSNIKSAVNKLINDYQAYELNDKFVEFQELEKYQFFDKKRVMDFIKSVIDREEHLYKMIERIIKYSSKYCLANNPICSVKELDQYFDNFNPAVKCFQQISKYNQTFSKKYIFSALFSQNPPTDNMIEILEHLVKLDCKSIHYKFFKAYFTFLKNISIKKFDNIKMLNKLNQWKNIRELMLDNGEVSDASIVKYEYQEILINADIDDLCTNLYYYEYIGNNYNINNYDILEYCENLVNNFKASKYVIGIFFSLIGNEKLKDEAKKYLEESNSTSDFQNLGAIDFLHEQEFIPTYTKDYQDYLCFNLLGEKFKPEIKDKIIFYLHGYDLRKSQVSLGFNNLALKKSDNINQILVDNIVFLFEKLNRLDDRFLIKTDKMRLLFEKFIDKNKANVEFVQFQIKNSILTLFRRFAKKKINEIQNLFDKEDAISLDEYRDLNPNSVREEKENLRNEAVRNLENNKNVRQVILSGIKNKLLTSQYSQYSVLYELFQNADDACVEKLSKLAIHQSENIFELISKGDIVDVIHNGRLINQYKSATKEVSDFKDDLLNMLMLDYSKKNDSEKITGKFGLGFKSVYLICDEPEIHSQDIHLKIIGGCYPIVINDFHDNLDITETMIRLKINEGINFLNILQKFTENIYYLLIFSNAINKIIIKNEIFKLNMSEVIVKDHFELFRFSKQEKIVLIKHSNFKLLFALSSNGFTNIKTSQKIWVTVPTETKTRYNFLINANFKIDVGRVQLAIRGNDKIFATIGKEFVIVLREIFDRSAYPLNLDKNKFWSSLFMLLTTSDDKDELHPIFWAHNSDNYLALLSELKILPNGLNGPYEDLVKLGSIKYVLADELNKVDFIELMEEQGIESNNTISELIFNLLKQNGAEFLNVKRLNIKNYKKILHISETSHDENLSDIETLIKADILYDTLEEKSKYIKIEKENREYQESKENSQKDSLKDFTEYSYGWLKKIAETDCQKSIDENTKKSGKVRFSNCSINKTGDLLTLKNPGSYLIQSYETAKNIIFSYGYPERELKNEILGVSLKDNHVEVLLKNRLKDEEKQNLLDKSMEGSYKLKFVDYADVSYKLFEAYHNLDLASTFSFKNNLPKSTFVFGPPGTGKTTNIAKKIINLITHDSEINILVMSFSNTACDEIFQKIAEQTESYDWLIRFGNSLSSRIVGENKIANSSDNHDMRHKVIITTAVRFSYDGYKNEKFETKKWDYVVLDEASMINIQLISYILYKASEVNTSCKFIIAGDPLQIPPIYKFTNNINKYGKEKKSSFDYKDLKEMEDNLDGENIYKMVGINTFNEDKQMIDKNKFKIEYLSTQYRSISPIGNIFSNLYYDGRLKHKRNTNDAKQIKLPGLDISNINLIDFPLLGGEIYHSRKINSSHAHPYSAILLLEMLSKIDNQIADIIEIGIVSPYKTQVKIIDKLIGRANFKNINLQIDTVHGFQGGQKDIMFCVLNPPVNETKSNDFSITCKENAHINKKYIINVALSRARDYLFILHPSNQYKSGNTFKSIIGFENLRRINDLTDYLSRNPGEVAKFTNRDIEKWCFNKEYYIYDNSIVLDHDSVNIYDIPAKKYVVSCDNTSIDIQTEKNDKELNL